MRLIALLVALLCLVFPSVGPAAPAAAEGADGKARVWLTVADPKTEPAVGLDPARRLRRMPDLAFADAAGEAGDTVSVDEGRAFQTMEGFGVSLTDAAAWLLHYKLDDAKRAEVMGRLFGPDGIALSMLRQPMGASDFAWSTYTYDDVRGDMALARFSVERDDAYIVPMVKAALAVNPAIKVVATPWSAPGWMKYFTNPRNGTGKLRAACYPVYARYFVRFIEAYRERGIPIFAVTPQNEPLFEPRKYPGMAMSVVDEVGFIGDYLGPALEAAGLDTLILAYDHNYDRHDYPEAVIRGLAERGKARHVAGNAFHHYGGDVAGMGATLEAHPDKGVWFTEGGFGDWNDPVDGTNRGFDNMIREFIAIPRQGAKCVILWNAALDQDDGPSVIGRGNGNKGMLTIRNSDGRNDRPEDRVTFMKQYYLLGHFSKFVAPGAVRVGSDGPGDLPNVAFRNPDGAVVLVAYNPRTVARTVEVRAGGLAVRCAMPGASVVTLTW